MKKSAHLLGSIQSNRFPKSLFYVFMLVLLITAGVNIGMVLLFQELRVNEIIQVHVVILYWVAVAAGLTLFTRSRIRIVYEEPMQKLALATKRVAEGDFSVHVPTVHAADKMDYMDVMILDFNKMVEDLGSIETLKTEFISNVSHELKTPVAIIQNNAELLRLSRLDEKQHAQVDAIYWATKRLTGLVSNILKLNKLEQQRILPEAKNYDVCAQLAECAVAMEDVLEMKGIELEADMEDTGMIFADPALMELVWNNLLSNAMKFTPHGGTVTITETATPEGLKIGVRDTGCGMDEETQRHIFEKFYQGDTSHATVGNGLGLALAQRVLLLHDFSIQVESTPGQGSCFTVTIPKAETPLHSKTRI